MPKKSNLLVAVALFALVAMVAFVSFSGDAESSDAAPVIGDSPFDLAAALENAAAGDTVALGGDTVLSKNASVKPGVILDDCGFSLRIPEYTTLSVEGTFVSSGNLIVEFRGALAVASGGLLSIDRGGEAEVAGSFEIYKGGIVNVGLEEKSSIYCYGNGRVMIDGVMTIGSNEKAHVISTVDVWNASLTGELRIGGGGIFKVYDIFVIGNAPVLTSEMDNDARIYGRVTLESTACVIVYGKSSFNSTNIISPSTWTEFVVLNKIYATEYKYTAGKRTLVLPSTSALKDYNVERWVDATGHAITDDTDIQIGSNGYRSITGELTKRTYTIVLAEDISIRWVVDGITKGSSGEESRAYDSKCTINIRLAPGYTETPSLFMNGVPYTAGTQFTVSADSIFATSNNYPAPRDSMVPTLLIIMAILLVILIASFIMLRTKNKSTE
ncbi:MAG: hypothetical protein FWG41_04300 [Methanomassiliicoccaceae archaeon]|nr:hypothetical protein [Methanomassiliicoccaceae archaeon]